MITGDHHLGILSSIQQRANPPDRSFLHTLQTCLFDPEFFTMRPGFFHNSTSSTYRSVELCLLSLCFRSVYGVLRSLFVFAEFFYLAPCSSMHLPSYRESKPRRDCSLWCLPCIVPYAVIIFEVVLCAVGPLVSKYLSLNTISPTSCLFWLEFTVSEEKPCASGTQGCSLLPSLKFIPFVLQVHRSSCTLKFDSLPQWRTWIQQRNTARAKYFPFFRLFKRSFSLWSIFLSKDISTSSTLRWLL